ncbi:MAG: type III secretion system export apparatus subunit SctR [Puniceicoccales bacterium]|jgi:type III secretion protein R|nr:type III secretion system export apparatus subunit SctR [Puniceicoccales bacterium]
MLEGLTMDPIAIIAILIALSLAPFILLLVSSFVKIAVVLSLIRNALGVQQVPPNMVLNGMAIMLTIYVMYPVVRETFSIVEGVNFKDSSLQEIAPVAQKAVVPLRKFLSKHTKESGSVFFMNMAKRMWPPEAQEGLSKEHLLILIPAFVVSELTAAFQIGFLLYLPFIAIDMIVSNILLAMGMMMVSPMTISLPFKMMLFVLIDGWTKLVEGLVKTYS